MFSFGKRSEPRGFGHLSQKLKRLGLNKSEINAVLKRVWVTPVSRRSEDFVAPGHSPTHSTVLLEGVACLYERLTDGSRQIFAFQYPGDFCDLNRHVLPKSKNEVAVAAITRCSVGMISHGDLEHLMSQYPTLATAMWRASILEASMVRQHLLSVGRRPALQRIAHLLCEQMARQEAVGIHDAPTPLSGADLADAAGLSIVHVSRTFKELQRLGLLAKEGRSMKVVDKAQLASLAGFDGDYLDMPQLLSDWQDEIEAPRQVASSRQMSLNGAEGRRV